MRLLAKQLPLFSYALFPRGSVTAPHNSDTPEACGWGAIDEADVATASRRGRRVSHTGFAMGRRNRSLRRSPGATAGRRGYHFRGFDWAIAYPLGEQRVFLLKFLVSWITQNEKMKGQADRRSGHILPCRHRAQKNAGQALCLRNATDPGGVTDRQDASRQTVRAGEYRTEPGQNGVPLLPGLFD